MAAWRVYRSRRQEYPRTRRTLLDGWATRWLAATWPAGWPSRRRTNTSTARVAGQQRPARWISAMSRRATGRHRDETQCSPRPTGDTAARYDRAGLWARCGEGAGTVRRSRRALRVPNTIQHGAPHSMPLSTPPTSLPSTSPHCRVPGRDLSAAYHIAASTAISMQCSVATAAHALLFPTEPMNPTPAVERSGRPKRPFWSCIGPSPARRPSRLFAPPFMWSPRKRATANDSLPCYSSCHRVTPLPQHIPQHIRNSAAVLRLSGTCMGAAGAELVDGLGAEELWYRPKHEFPRQATEGVGVRHWLVVAGSMRSASLPPLRRLASTGYAAVQQLILVFIFPYSAVLSPCQETDVHHMAIVKEVM